MVMKMFPSNIFAFFLERCTCSNRSKEKEWENITSKSQIPKNQTSHTLASTNTGLASL